MSSYSCRYELETWGEFQVRTLEGLGYPSHSSLSWALTDHVKVRQTISKLPIGVSQRGLTEYLLVERALYNLGQQYRSVAIIEYAAPIIEVGKSMAKRACTAGMSVDVYRRHLRQIHAEICCIFDSREHSGVR